MAETNGLLNRRTGKSGTESSNLSVSAKFRHFPAHRSPAGNAQKHGKPLVLCRLLCRPQCLTQLGTLLLVGGQADLGGLGATMPP